MDLLPEVDLTQYFEQHPKRVGILHRLQDLKFDTAETLLYMFTRAPPILYIHFYTILDLAPSDLHFLKFLVETIEKDMIQIRYQILKNSRILTKLNESVVERKDYRVERANTMKYAIRYRLQIGKRMVGIKQPKLNQILLDTSEETGIPLFTLSHWGQRYEYYTKMVQKYPGIVNIFRFGKKEIRFAEMGRTVFERGIQEAKQMIPKMRDYSLCRKLLFYIECAGFKFNEQIEALLEVLHVKSQGCVKVIYPQVKAFEEEYHKWVQGGGKVQIAVPEHNNMINDINAEESTKINETRTDETKDYMCSDGELSEEISKPIELSDEMDTSENNKWERTQATSGRRGAKRVIPRINSISHRFVKDTAFKRRPGKTKFDIIEERWACVILHKYLVLMPAEIANVAKVSHTTVWHSIELYETYGPRGLVEDVRRERMAEKVREKFGEQIKELARECSVNGESLHLNKTVNFLKSKGNQISKSVVADVLKKLGYSYAHINAVQYKERNKAKVIEMRKQYISDFFTNRESGLYNEVYVDESFVRQFKQAQYCWMTEEEHKTRCVPVQSTYNQVTIVGAINTNGWVGVDYPNLSSNLHNSNSNYTFHSGAILYYKSVNPDRSDPHTCFTRDSFNDYFTNHLLPSLSTPSIIIMDRATYHTHRPQSKFDIRKANKPDLLEYLLTQGINLDSKCSTQELRYKVLRMFPEGSRTYLDLKAENEGHRVLYTPPYHPELNPIEMAWSIVKRYYLFSCI